MHHHAEKLYQIAREILNNAYAPYSKHPVGVSVLADTGEIFKGANVENASSPVGTCAEPIAISSMVISGLKNPKIVEICVVGNTEQPCYPCGRCRQFINEFATENTLVHVGNKDGLVETVKFIDLLPKSFGPANMVDV